MSSAPEPLDPRDEHRHEPDDDPLWNESWYYDWATSDGRLGGYVRIGLYPNLDTVWYWACVVGEGRPLVTRIDNGVALPARSSLAISGKDLAADHVCESDCESWHVTADALAIALDDPAETYRGLRGEPVPLGIDLRWETANAVYPQRHMSRYEVPCRVHGEIRVGTERVAVDTWGERDHSWGRRDWWQRGWCWTAARFADASAFHAVYLFGDPGAFVTGYWQEPGGIPRDLAHFGSAPTFGREGLTTIDTMQIDDRSVTCTPLAFSPVLLVAPDGRESRFPRALCRFEIAGGPTGYGWTEWNQPQPGR